MLNLTRIRTSLAFLRLRPLQPEREEVFKVIIKAKTEESQTYFFFSKFNV